MDMTTTKPYLFRAFYDWICDNNCTPYVVVNVELPKVHVPMEYVRDGQIVLNISVSAIREFYLDNDELSFTARFNGKVFDVYVPMVAILALYAQENGKGVVFAEQDFTDTGGPDQAESLLNVDAGAAILVPPQRITGNNKKAMGNNKKGKPHLTVVKKLDRLDGNKEDHNQH